MRKPRGGQILANRVIGPREVLGGGDRRVPSKGRGRTEPHRGRSGASWIWSTPLHTGASEGEFRSGYALTPSPSHSKNISLFTERRTSERTVSEDGYSSFLFNPLWGFPVVAAGILFVVDHTRRPPLKETDAPKENREPSSTWGVGLFRWVSSQRCPFSSPD